MWIFEFPDENGLPYKSNGGKWFGVRNCSKFCSVRENEFIFSEFVALSQGIQVDVEDQLFEENGMNRFLELLIYTKY